MVEYYHKNPLYQQKVIAIRATTALIHLDHLKHNLEEIRRRLKPGVKICAAVKADAYGHGAIPVARCLEENGVDYLAVATVEEGRELREAGITTPLLLLGLVPLPDIPEMVEWDLQPVVAEETAIRHLQTEGARQNKTVRVHLKVDTGMGRLGCRPDEAPALAKSIVHSLNLELEGLCTHFPLSDNGESEPTTTHLRTFRDTVEELRSRGFRPRLLHAANSGAILDFPESHLDMVRAGILLYGYHPDPGVRHTGDFRPVMELRSKVMFLKTVPPGTGLSYGLTYVTERETRVATIPLGYADGYFRGFSNRAPLRIGEVFYQVSGRVCMDQIVVDLKDREAPVACGDPVLLFGPQGPTAWDLARLVGTIPYEITCAVSRRVPRIYVP